MLQWLFKKREGFVFIAIVFGQLHHIRIFDFKLYKIILETENLFIIEDEVNVSV